MKMCVDNGVVFNRYLVYLLKNLQLRCKRCSEWNTGIFYETICLSKNVNRKIFLLPITFASMSHIEVDHFHLEKKSFETQEKSVLKITFFTQQHQGVTTRYFPISIFHELENKTKQNKQTNKHIYKKRISKSII